MTPDVSSVFGAAHVLRAADRDLWEIRASGSNIDQATGLTESTALERQSNAWSALQQAAEQACYRYGEQTLLRVIDRAVSGGWADAVRDEIAELRQLIAGSV